MSAVPPGYPPPPPPPPPAAPAPPAYPQWPYGYGPPPPPPVRPTSTTTVVLIVALAIVGVLVLGTVAAGLAYLYVQRGAVASSSASPEPSPSPSPGVTATSDLRADQGRVVYSDDFSGPNSGWYVGTYSSGTSFAYSSSGYVVVAKGFFSHFVESPFGSRLAQVGMAVTGTQAIGAPADAGFGVSCVTGAGTTKTRFALMVEQSGRYVIFRFSPDAPGVTPDTITSGRSPLQPGTTPITLVGMCATLSDGHTVRLGLFAGSTLVADVTDRLDSNVEGWSAGLAFESAASHSSTDTITNFVERDLSR